MGLPDVWARQPAVPSGDISKWRRRFEQENASRGQITQSMGYGLEKVYSTSVIASLSEMTNLKMEAHNSPSFLDFLHKPGSCVMQ